MKVEELQNIAFSLGLVIKIQVRETIGLCFFKIVIAEQTDNGVKIWGEMKGWTYLNKKGIQLDTLRILSNSPPFVSELIWASTMAWSIEMKVSKKARLLAIYDTEGYSKRLVRYFKIIGFKVVKEVGSSPLDLFFKINLGRCGNTYERRLFLCIKQN